MPIAQIPQVRRQHVTSEAVREAIWFGDVPRTNKTLLALAALALMEAVARKIEAKGGGNG